MKKKTLLQLVAKKLVIVFFNVDINARKYAQWIANICTIQIKKKDILGDINTYSNKNLVHTLLLINFVKKYYFPNLFIL
jgi:hypothetical protein